MRKAIQGTDGETDYNICSQIMELRVGWVCSVVLTHGDFNAKARGRKGGDGIAAFLPQYPPLAELRAQVFHAAVAFDGVAGVA